MSKKIRIGNAGGFWGDDRSALKRQIQGGELDFITMDFLAEITMSIMQKQKVRNPELGYARDFITMLEDVLDEALKKNVKIITNAGGVNPRGCAEEIEKLAQKLGKKIKIGIVYGDDILNEIDYLQNDHQIKFDNMETSEKFDGVKDRLVSANIYFGAKGVVQALAAGADVIVTGRVTDTGITLATMMHSFGWADNDWDKLASGIVAGHVLECGAQSTGGNFTDWRLVESYDNIGFPIVEVNEDGTFVVTKHEGTGGLVSVDTVREQLFYEMGNPKAYITPDVVADFSTIQLEAAGKDRVRVFGVKGQEPTNMYKVSMAYRDGYKVSGAVAVCGPDADKKAEVFKQIFWKKVGTNFEETHTEFVGWNSCHGSLAKGSVAEEIILRFGARDADKDALLKMSRTIPSLILSGPAGICVMGGVEKPREVISYWPALMTKKAIKPKVEILGQEPLESQPCVTGSFQEKATPVSQIAKEANDTLNNILSTDTSGKSLISSFAIARSGDKGDMANIGLMARDKKSFEIIKSKVTAQFVKNIFQEFCHGDVVRYELENMQGFNFLLERSLGGGGTKTLRLDAQGKMFAQALLRQFI